LRYWDTSAIVPAVVHEAGSASVRAILAEDPVVVTWAWTRVEIVGAIERKARAGKLGPGERRAALERFERLADSWSEVTDLLAVRARALSVLRRHPLRAADSAQLAAALLLAEQSLPGLGFVCLDERLAEAADREGLRVSPRQAS
jgi:predicted nucleic acid-binding protein